MRFVKQPLFTLIAEVWIFAFGSFFFCSYCSTIPLTPLPKGSYPDPKTDHENPKSPPVQILHPQTPTYLHRLAHPSIRPQLSPATTSPSTHFVSSFASPTSAKPPTCSNASALTHSLTLKSGKQHTSPLSHTNPYNRHTKKKKKNPTTSKIKKK